MRRWLDRLLAWLPPRPATQQDQDESIQLDDLDRVIAACTRIIRDWRQPRASRAAAYNRRGLARFHQRDFLRFDPPPTTIDDFTQALALEPEFTDALLNRSRAYRARGEQKQAQSDLNEVLRRAPSHVDALCERGLYDLAHGDHQAAVRAYSTALEINPDDLMARHGRAVVFDQMRAHDSAIEDYSFAIHLDPTDHYALIARGNSYRAVWDFDMAIADYTASIALSDQDPSVFHERGHVYRAKGEMDRAIEDYTQAVARDSRFAIGFFNRGVAHHAKYDFDRAIADYTTALEIEPRYVYSLATLRLEKDREYMDDSDAIHNAHRMIRLEPTIPVALTNRALAYRAKGDLERAIADCNNAIEIEPRRSVAHGLRALLYYEAQDFAAAALALTDHAPSDVRSALFWHLSEIRADMLSSEAIENAAKKSNPILWPYAALELFLGQKTADAMLAKARRQGHEGEGYYFLAQWHLVRGEWSAATDALKIAIDKSPRDLIELYGMHSELARLVASEACNGIP